MAITFCKGVQHLPGELLVHLTNELLHHYQKNRDPLLGFARHVCVSCPPRRVEGGWGLGAGGGHESGDAHSGNDKSTAAFALSLVLFVEACWLCPTYRAPARSFAPLGSLIPFFLDSHIDVLSVTNTNSATACVRSTCSLSCRGS